MQLHTLTSQPLTCIALRALAKIFGGLRTMERFGVLPRPNYAYGLVRAADMARFTGKSAVTVCEFGVAEGAGLLNMAVLAEVIGRETGVRFRVVGFDTGEGLPPPNGYKDHPELWSAGDFPMPNRETLLARLEGKAEMVFGNIKDTVAPFVDSLSQDAPLGFVAVDVDIHSSATDSLRCLLGPRAKLNPAVSLYLDDVGTFFSNRWCGELAAIAEFNAGSEARKIDGDRSLPGTRPVQNAGWYRRMHVCHVLDHEARTRATRREGLSLEDHALLMQRFSQ
jgi:hypothetical protein